MCTRRCRASSGASSPIRRRPRKARDSGAADCALGAVRHWRDHAATSRSRTAGSGSRRMAIGRTPVRFPGPGAGFGPGGHRHGDDEGAQPLPAVPQRAAQAARDGCEQQVVHRAGPAVRRRDQLFAIQGDGRQATVGAGRAVQRRGPASTGRPAPHPAREGRPSPRADRATAGPLPQTAHAGRPQRACAAWPADGESPPTRPQGPGRRPGPSPGAPPDLRAGLSATRRARPDPRCHRRRHDGARAPGPHGGPPDPSRAGPTTAADHEEVAAHRVRGRAEQGLTVSGLPESPCDTSVCDRCASSVKPGSSCHTGRPHSRGGRTSRWRSLATRATRGRGRLSGWPGPGPRLPRAREPPRCSWVPGPCRWRAPRGRRVWPAPAGAWSTQHPGGGAGSLAAGTGPSVSGCPSVAARRALVGEGAGRDRVGLLEPQS